MSEITRINKELAEFAKIGLFSLPKSTAFDLNSPAFKKLAEISKAKFEFENNLIHVGRDYYLRTIK